jgi:hypothetical protein
MKKVFPYIVVIILCYLIISLIKWDLSFHKWEQMERVAFVILCCGVCLMYSIRQIKNS